MRPLDGLRIVEFAGLGPAPMCGMLLSELGAKVIRIDRREAVETGFRRPARFNLLNRSRPWVALDLKDDADLHAAKRLVANADGLIEGFRPGVMERLGLGPDDCHRSNARLVYGRVTGWGQTGPLAQVAGHDLNYIALTGALDAIGRRGCLPSPPLNLVGDFGGGALYLVAGMLAGLLAVQRGGAGMTIDAAMVDGASSLMTAMFGMHAAGLHPGPRGTNALDSGAPYYDIYPCADGRLIAVAALEPKFRANLFERLDIDAAWVRRGVDPSHWEELRSAMASRFLEKSRDVWCEALEMFDCCVSPVLSMEEAAAHPQIVARRTIVSAAGVVQPSVAPRFSSDEGPVEPEAVQETATELGDVFRDWNIAED